MSAGGATRKNLTAGSTRSSKTEMPHEHRSRFLEMLAMSQIVALFLIVIISLLNLSLTNHDDLGYLVPNPRLRHGSSGEDEPIHNIAAKQQLNGPLPGQHGVAMENETE